MADACSGIADGDDVPADCINADFCSAEPVRQLRHSQREARKRADQLLLLVQRQYPHSKTA